MNSFVVRLQVGKTIREYVRSANNACQMRKAIQDSYPGIILVEIYKL